MTRLAILTGILGLGALAIFLSAENPEPPSICIQPFAGIPAEHVEEVRAALSRYYQTDVQVLDSVELPEETFTDVKTPRYRADKLLVWLRENRPEGCDHILGLTHRDISTTKYEDWATKKIKEPAWKYEDWGVFGLGHRPGPACVVSTFRLKKDVDDAKVRERLRKIACHEVGHNLGLPHCPNVFCFMRDAAEKIGTVDLVNEALCEKCAGKIGLPKPE